MPLPTAVLGIPMTSAGDIPGIPGGNSSTGSKLFSSNIHNSDEIMMF